MNIKTKISDFQKRPEFIAVAVSAGLLFLLAAYKVGVVVGGLLYEGFGK